MAKKYASDFLKMIDEERKKYSEDDYLDLLKELRDELETRIYQKQMEDDGEIDELSHLL